MSEENTSLVRAKTVSNSKNSLFINKNSVEFKHLLANWSDSYEYDTTSEDDMGSSEAADERIQLTGRVAAPETTSISSAYFNLTVCVLASALLSIPFGFDKTGWLGGLLLLTLVGALVDYTLLCLGDTCIKLGVYDYQEIAEISFGKVGRYVQALVQLSLSLSLMISYQIISADNVEGMLKLEWIRSANSSNIPLDCVIVLLLTTLIILPLTSFATLKMLSYSSMISILSILILSLSLFYFDMCRDPINTVLPIGSELFTGLGVFATGFVCHQIITPTLDSLPGDIITKKQSYHKVVHLAIGTSFLFFAAVGIMGYYLCHDSTGRTSCPGNILKWSDPTIGSISDSIYGKVATAMFLITALVAYPLEHFSCYNTICRLLYGEWGHPSKTLGLFIKLSLVALTTVPAMFIKDVGPLVAWAGNLAAFPLGFLLPLSLAIKNRNKGVPSPLKQTIIRSILLSIAVLLMLLQTFESLTATF